MKQSHLRMVLGAVAAALIAAATQAQDAEPAPASTLPDAQSKREVIGPQPGPDGPLPSKENPYKGDKQAIVEGRRLFVWFNCSGCHGGRAGGGMGPSLRDAAWMYGNSHQDIFNSISEGRPHGMPAWGTKLPVEQIWKLTAYVKSMNTDKEPAKPPENPVFPNPPPRRDVKGVTAGGGDEDEGDQ